MPVLANTGIKGFYSGFIGVRDWGVKSLRTLNPKPYIKEFYRGSIGVLWGSIGVVSGLGFLGGKGFKA